jgi:hypothetical protein
VLIFFRTYDALMFGTPAFAQNASLQNSPDQDSSLKAAQELFGLIGGQMMDDMLSSMSLRKAYVSLTGAGFLRHKLAL